jgi:hypothetical protein
VRSRSLEPEERLDGLAERVIGARSSVEDHEDAHARSDVVTFGEVSGTAPGQHAVLVPGHFWHT